MSQAQKIGVSKQNQSPVPASAPVRKAPPLTGAERFVDVIRNYLATMAFLGFACFFYLNSDYHKGFLGATWKLTAYPDFEMTTRELFLDVLLFYSLILWPFYGFQPGVKSKVRTAFAYPWKRFILGHNVSPTAAKAAGSAGRALIIKFFFGALMVKWLSDHIFGMINHGYTVMHAGPFLQSFDSFLAVFNSGLYWFAFDIILFADVVFFTLGYLIETPRLDNEIVSAEPSLFGWVVCLLCYPPFNKATNGFLGWHSSDFPHFGLPYLHVFFNCMILVLMSLYASASVSLNWKASNLTNRGVVSRGLYSVIRHPAYISKNLAWWVGGFPAIWGALTGGGMTQTFFVFLSLMGTSLIYGLRAYTEELHMLKGNNGYAEYMQKVKYRFIPGIF